MTFAWWTPSDERDGASNRVAGDFGAHSAPTVGYRPSESVTAGHLKIATPADLRRSKA